MGALQSILLGHHSIPSADTSTCPAYHLVGSFAVAHLLYTMIYCSVGLYRTIIDSINAKVAASLPASDLSCSMHR